ncbi:hypothetical protein DSCW_35600 [Desulfosarcina widdelii]|uniref:Bacteriophage lambda Replication protein O N-terminal domain-containing protein n=1 Tax=Desulfosarcina widdelii TaxID=947919 RepID=A0A5K7Z8F8_9BACT|nr:hypothetical protein [Desulfosarcina widdelii]BBO76143.1 hypothetical protein DSCW_35600 [Desulfosarcina widdelii]
MLPFIQMMRSEETRELLQRPNEFMLLALIAYRAKRTNGFSAHNLEIGEALIGDHKSCGLTRQKYRSALNNLRAWQFITTKTTNKGTIAKIINSNVFNVNCEIVNHQDNQKISIEQPLNNHQTTTNNNDKKEKKGKNERDTLSSISRCPYQKITQIFSDLLPELPTPNLDNNLKKQIRSRWKEHPDLEWWRWYFAGVSGCDFLMGRKSDWHATLHWLTGPQNMSKVLNGQYLNRKPMDANQAAGQEFVREVRNG